MNKSNQEGRAAGNQSQGQGANQKPANALEMYRKAARSGDANAMFNLGCAYDEGEGVKLDHKKAVKWYRKGAEAGNAYAMRNLGAAYETGKGVKKSIAEARKWYDKAEAMKNDDLLMAAESGSPDDELIVDISFDYCNRDYTGSRIMRRSELVRLKKGMDLGVRVSALNMPDNWSEEFDIGLLRGCFSIRSEDAADVAAMRRVFGDGVGDTGYFYTVLDALDEAEENESQDKRKGQE